MPGEMLRLRSVEIVTINRFELTVIKKWDNSTGKPGLKSEMRWAHWTVRVLQAHIQAYLKSNSSRRHHCKSSLLGPELSSVISEITQPAHHMQGMTQCDLNHMHASKVFRWAGKEQRYNFLPNRCFILDKLLKKWDMIQTTYTAGTENERGHSDF